MNYNYEIRRMKAKIHAFEDMLFRSKHSGEQEAISNELRKLRIALQRLEYKRMESYK